MQVVSWFAGQSGCDRSASSRLTPFGVPTWRKTIWASRRIIQPSFPSPAGSALLACTIPHKPNKLYQRLRGEQNRLRSLRRNGGQRDGYGQVGPLPGEREEGTVLTAQDHPGGRLTPEDAADAPRLPTGGTLLSQDRGTRSLKCNIRCSVFGG